MSKLSRNIVFTIYFIEWWETNKLPLELELNSVVNHSYEFADFRGFRPLTKMSLSKALEKCEVKKRWRYLRVDESEYKKKSDWGQQRPRVLMIGMGLPRGLIVK